MSLVSEIGTLLEPYLEDDRFFVVGLNVKPGRNAQQVTILLDSDEGITIEQCASISRRLAADIEKKEIFTTAYNLEVSSPGLEHPLVLPRQYAKSIGRNMKIYRVDGQVIEGKLEGVVNDELLLELPPPKKKPKKGEEAPDLKRVIPLKEVEKALVQVSFK